MFCSLFSDLHVGYLDRRFYFFAYFYCLFFNSPWIYVGLLDRRTRTDPTLWQLAILMLIYWVNIKLLWYHALLYTHSYNICLYIYGKLRSYEICKLMKLHVYLIVNKRFLYHYILSIDKRSECGFFISYFRYQNLSAFATKWKVNVLTVSSEDFCYTEIVDSWYFLTCDMTIICTKISVVFSFRQDISNE